MRTIQSMILGEPGKDKPNVVPSTTKEDVKTTVQPSSSIMPDPVTPAPEAPAPDEYPSNGTTSESNGQKRVNESQLNQQPPEQFNSMGDVVDAYYKAKMPTEEELKKEKKREKSRQIISAIADGVSAISNLYFTGKGAKNVEQTSMSAANTKRYQEILDRRRKMQDKWDDARLNASIRDTEQTNRMEAARIERKHREDLLKAKTDTDVDALNKKFDRDMLLLQEKNKAIADEGQKRRVHEKEMTDNKNTATIKAAGIRASGSGSNGNSDKEFTYISDGKGGSVRVRIKDVTPENIGKVYAGMIKDNPEFAIKEQGKNDIGGPAKDDKGNPIMVTVPNPTADQMRAAIGRSIGKSKSVQDSYKEISGYGNSNSGTSKKKIKGF